MNMKQMVQRIVCLAATCSLVALVSTATASEMGQAAANQITDATYRYFLGDSEGVPGILYTHAGDSRDVGDPQHDLARDNIADHFASYGLTVTLEPVVYSSTTYYNVVATKLGTTFPDQEFIIGAHYDSINWSGPAPGADDNASGVSLVLECARVLSQYDSEYTIRFIAFTREEQGLYGSNAYVDDHFGDDILAMISADMVAYDPDTEHALIYGHDSPALPLKSALQAAIAEYGEYQGVSLTSSDEGWNGQSDHAPFDSAGYQACLLIEGEVWSNPNYHSAGDNVDNPGYINYDYATRMTRSVCGYLVDNANVLVDVDALTFDFPDGQPEYISPAGGTRMRVEVAGLGDAVPQPGTGTLYYTGFGGWQSTPMDAISDNVYEAVFPATPCGDELFYYVGAETTGGEEFTSPWSAPLASHSAISAYGRAVVFEETFDTDPGWTTQGLWAFGQPTGDGGQYGGPDPTSGYTGDNVYGYNLSGDYENNLPERHLTSTAIDCTGYYNLQLSFWRWLGVERPLYDHAYVRVSTDGTTWTTLWENSATIEETDWSLIEIDLPMIDNEQTVYLRWTMGTTDTAWQYCGWNIDDVQLTALQCEPEFAAGDLNCDGLINSFDIDPFVLALTSPAAYELAYPDCYAINADIDGNGLVNSFDIDPFVLLLTGG